MWKFLDKHNLGNPYTLIHPKKQKIVKYLVDNIPNEVDYVIVFGSSIMPYCQAESDIDVAFVGECEYKDLDRAFVDDQEYDVLIYKSLDEVKQRAFSSRQNVEREIYENGVLVYER